MICRNCDNEIDEKMAFCPYCGMPAEMQQDVISMPKICRLCGRELGEDENFCPGCGTPRESINQIPEHTEEKRRPKRPKVDNRGYRLPICLILIIMSIYSINCALTAFSGYYSIQVATPSYGGMGMSYEAHSTIVKGSILSLGTIIKFASGRPLTTNIINTVLFLVMIGICAVIMLRILAFSSDGRIDLKVLTKKSVLPLAALILASIVIYDLGFMNSLYSRVVFSDGTDILSLVGSDKISMIFGMSLAWEWLCLFTFLRVRSGSVSKPIRVGTIMVVAYVVYILLISFSHVGNILIWVTVEDSEAYSYIIEGYFFTFGRVLFRGLILLWIAVSYGGKRLEHVAVMAISCAIVGVFAVTLLVLNWTLSDITASSAVLITYRSFIAEIICYFVIGVILAILEIRYYKRLKKKPV